MKKILINIAFYPLNLILALLVIAGSLVFAIVRPQAFLKIVTGIVKVLQQIQKLDEKMDEVTINQVIEWKDQALN